MNIIVPLNKRVIVEPEAKEEVTKGGIIIPDAAGQKAPTKGRVISISEDSNLKLKISSGDLVLFSKYAGTEIVIPAPEADKKDRHLQVIKDEDILAVIKYENAG